jgi:Putative adhesin
MTLRILCTLAILAGLAAAPGAEQFRWEAGRSDADLADRIADDIERMVERLSDSAEHLAHRLSHRVERAAERAAARIKRRAEIMRHRVESRIERHIERGGDWERSRGGWRDQSSIADDPCREQDRRDDDYYRHCEVREERLPAGPLTVDAGQNGGIRVEGWDGSDILVRAVVQASAREEADAKRLAGEVEVQAGGGRVTARGPDRSTGPRQWWSVSYRISVPRRTDLDLNASNGGITIANVAGTIRFDTTNGGVRLADVGGAVNGRTRNGGVRIALGGNHWDGEGLDVETSNGGVTLSIPEPYNAQLETRTVNGGLRFDYPLTITGELSPRRGISTALGSGGAPVRVRTTNGGLRIERR